MQVSTSTVEAPTAAETTGSEQGVTDIYIGKGRYVKDDPKKYPGKDDLGPLIGAVGACTQQQLSTAGHTMGPSSRTVVMEPPVIMSPLARCPCVAHNPLLTHPGLCLCAADCAVTGGWAGGEAALLQLREQLQREKSAKKAVNAAISSSSSKVQPPAPKGGLQPIYVGYGKE